MLGGLIVGLVALMFPQILGVGYEATDTVLQGGYILWMLLALLVLKILMTSVSLGAGFGGGVFSPALFIGAMTGGAVGLLAASIVPETIASHGLFAIIGMGAVAGAVLGAPISTFLIVFELIGDYQLSIAIMVATMLASVIARQSGTLSFFHGQLEQRGLRLRSGRARHIVQTKRIGEVMSSDYRSIEPAASMDDVRLRLPLAPHSLLVLQDADRRFKGMITPHSLQELEDGDKEVSEAADAAEQPSRLVYRDDPLQKALTAFDVTNPKPSLAYCCTEMRWPPITACCWKNGRKNAAKTD
jgi:CIC family chloride channel protein